MEDASKSPLQEYVEEWKEKGQRTIRFFRQRTAILRDPRILQEACPGNVAGWKTPLAFASYGLLLTSIAVSATGFVLDNLLNIEQPKHEWFLDSERLSAQLKINEDLLAQAKRLSPSQRINLEQAGETGEFGRDEAVVFLTEENHKLVREKILNGIFNWLTDYSLPVLATVSIISGSIFFKRRIVKNLSNSKFCYQADRYYLYIVTSRLFWGNVLISVAFASDQLWLADVGGALGIYLLYRSSKDMYVAFDVSPPRSYWTGANKTFAALTAANAESFVMTSLISFALGAALYGVLAAVA